MPNSKFFRRFMFNPRDVSLLRHALEASILVLTMKKDLTDEDRRNLTAYEDLYRRFQ